MPALAVRFFGIKASCLMPCTHRDSMYLWFVQIARTETFGIDKKRRDVRTGTTRAQCTCTRSRQTARLALSGESGEVGQ